MKISIFINYILILRYKIIFRENLLYKILCKIFNVCNINENIILRVDIFMDK